MIVIDIETTGLNPFKHSILEIGAVDFKNPSNRFYGKCRIFEGAEVDENSLKVNGYSYSQLNDLKKLELKDMILNFIEWTKPIKNKTLAGQNVDFDILFLNESLKRCQINWSFGWRKIDLHTLVYSDNLKKRIDPPMKNELSDLSGNLIMNYVGLPMEPKPHTGINGALYEAEAFSRLIYGTLLINEFEKHIIPSHLCN
ncbi:3'-5' exonuclease [Flavobacterium sp. LHD-85]|uniref:3'-5' exonuclease n=1 Tax=Flavobacterium sp. LHD-85 TaxID=3071410 RepID=UPI0027E18D3D|nr:3'-5' exonuclease [Flavobacterium sp. LHD-85]MDQ6532111.1 3'-5' exonuclease [Flavobacterium sp. LHD-85]